MENNSPETLSRHTVKWIKQGKKRTEINTKNYLKKKDKKENIQEIDTEVYLMKTDKN